MLHIHRAERADGLVEGLGALLAAPLPDPMQAEVVAVPTRGVERWLAQRLASRLGVTAGRTDGVCANLEFPFPGRLVGGATAAATGVDGDGDAWLPERSVWPLLDVVDASLSEPWLWPLAAHLGGFGARAEDPKRTRRFASLRHIADLYDRYGVHRPQMLAAWASGDNVDGAGEPLADDTVWQAELWRRLRVRLGRPSPAERLQEACSRLRAEPHLSDLPARVSLFGLTRLAASYLDVLRALAVARDVHLFLLHPSPVLWERIADATRRSPLVSLRAADPTIAMARNPLLASWGRDAREMQLVLRDRDGSSGENWAAAHVDHHHRVATAAGTLLERLQDDVRADRSPPGVPRPGQPESRALLEATDRSIQVHACHGRARQVEIVRDAILHLLEEDPSLEARDVIVMCPDIEAFAPLVHATFGTGPAADPDATVGTGSLEGAARPDLRVRLADRALRQTNPVLATVSELLVLADARVTASQVLDLAGRGPVRRRFDFDDDDLSRLAEWVGATGVRWGFDGGHRGPFKLEGLEANTWRSGLDRVLLGVAMAEEGQRLLGGVLPLDDVDSGAIELAGRFAEFIDRLQGVLGGLCAPQPLGAWVPALLAAVDALTATTAADGWQRAQVQRLLDEVVADASGATGATDLALPEVRSLFADRLRGRPTRANFRTGHLTVCTLVPMRSVPHRVVCLVGLDDGVFPRKCARDGDDLILDDPHVGDRDPRSEDRQLLLDALLAATGHLVITYTGRDERTNAERPPAVPVGELLDVIDRTVHLAAPMGASATPPLARHHVVVQHPLQPFDPRNFTPGRLVAHKEWSFDSGALAGARALAGPRSAPLAFVAGRLPAAASEVVELDDLVRFVQHPVRAFLRQRLGVSVDDWSQNPSDELPLRLDALEQWGVGERLLEARLSGAGLESCVAAEIARGVLPPDALAASFLHEVCPTVEHLVAAATALVSGPAEPTSVEVAVRLAGGRALVGTVPGLIGTLLRSVTYSRVGPKHRLAAWVRFLVLTAGHPATDWASATLGRRRDGARSTCRVTTARLAPFEGPAEVRQGRAVEHLDRLVELYDGGMCEPLPLYCATSAAYAAAVAAGKPGPVAVKSAARAWESGDYDKEDNDPGHLLVLGGRRSCDEALDDRFVRYAVRLWDGLLSCEELIDR